MTNEELIHFREFYSRGEQKMTRNMNIEPAIGCVRDSAESLKPLVDNIMTSGKMLREDIDCIKRFLFNPPADTVPKESPEPTCIVDSLRQALGVIERCRDACDYIKERLG